MFVVFFWSGVYANYVPRGGIIVRGITDLVVYVLVERS